MAGQTLFLLSGYATYMTGGDYLVDGYVPVLDSCAVVLPNSSSYVFQPPEVS